MKRSTTHHLFSTSCRIYAWLLLAVYVPMVALSSLHVHHIAPLATVIDCEMCDTHMHHSGHFTASTHQHCDCLACRFLGTQVTQPTEQPRLALTLKVERNTYTQPVAPVKPAVTTPSLRAPPALIL